MAVDLSKMTKKDLARYFDYSVLPKNSVKSDILKGCEETRKYRFAAFYTSAAYWVPLVKDELSDYPDVLIGIGVSFPFGSQTPEVKAFETEQAVKMGATAVDVVMNIGALNSGDYDTVRKELRLFKEAAGPALTKCIIETCYVKDEQIADACKMIAEAGIAYAKTSSGQFEGPSMEQFLVMKRALVGTDCKLKVAGVKFPRPQNAYAFLMAGAELIGTRAAPEIIEGLDMCREIGIVPPYKG